MNQPEKKKTPTKKVTMPGTFEKKGVLAELADPENCIVIGNLEPISEANKLRRESKNAGRD